MKKSSGILMPVFALSGKYGIGTFGSESYKFVDFLCESGQSVWQMLPLSQTVYGDSPYQTTADGSFNPYFCDLEQLFTMGLLTEKELKSAEEKVTKIDYGKLYVKRTALLKKAFSRYDFEDGFLSAVNSKKYYGYAVFMTAKTVYGEYKNFPLWLKTHEKRLIDRFIEENNEEFLFYNFTQYIVENQFFKLKKYANEKGVKLMGDLPLYVAYDSAEVWKNPELFMLDEEYKPIKVAGVPPDYFSQDGQLWGNPLYDYDKMEKDGFKWWKARLKRSLKTFDLVRIDHFRGLDRFWAIPYGESAKAGEWTKAYGEIILKEMPKNRLIAEDLGVIDDGVIALLEKTGLAGMKVLLFAFDGNPDNPYLPKNIGYNSIAYVGTHDNDTAYGYVKTLSKEEFNVFLKSVNSVIPKGAKKVTSKKGVVNALIETLFNSEAKLVITTFADLNCLDNKFRINTPSTVGNWTVRYPEKYFTDELSKTLLELTQKAKRI
ncbi:MAG: 4-alpha-glucanotransferase [Clostridiales bacterium]|nr:4-alpha-glucanotransferase [Clostridiales bacterium]